MLAAEVAAGHPVLGVEMPYSEEIARAFEWQPHRCPITEKYGSGTEAVRALFRAFQPLAEAKIARAARATGSVAA
jgi:hypothetical protein